MAAGTAENNIERRENKLLALGSTGAALAGHDLIDPDGRTLGALCIRAGVRHNILYNLFQVGRAIPGPVY